MTDLRTDEQKNADLTKIIDMPLKSFINLCMQWRAEKTPDLSKMDPLECPVHGYALLKGRCLSMQGNIDECPVCGSPMCPACGSHTVEQLSRVTGYLSGVSGWNNAKKQEFKDRTRHNITRF